MPELIAGVMAPLLPSVAVMKFVPVVLRTTVNCFVPATKAALPGRVASKSFAARLMTSVTLLMMFQLASTALTDTLNEVSGEITDGVPVLPVRVPGAQVSPGTKTSSFVNEPALTVIGAEVVFDKLPLLKIRVMVSAT